MSKIPKGRKCHICKSDNTYISPDGYPGWYKDYDNKGNFTGEYLCHMCHLEIEKEKNKKIRELRLKKRVCCICGNNDTHISNSGTYQWLKYRNEKGDWDGKSYMCYWCWGKNYQRNNPDSQHNILRSISNCRTGEYNVDNTNLKGLIGELIITRVHKAKNANIDDDNFKSKFDLIDDYKYGIVQVKTRSLYLKKYEWYYDIGIDSEFDTLFLVCMDENEPWNKVSRIYAIPNKELFGKTSVTISLNGIKWEEFRINEKLYDSTYQDLLSYFKDKKFDFENIKKWLSIDRM